MLYSAHARQPPVTGERTVKYEPLRLAKKHDKMMKLARRASKARDALVDYIESAKSRPLEWQAMCDQHGISPDADFADFMA